MKKSEKVASTILRILAIVGLIAILVLATWVVVQGSRALPNIGQNLSAAASSVRSIFRTAPSESLVFELENRTLAVSEPFKVSWTYTGENQPTSYTFTYECGSNVELNIEHEYGWDKLPCGTAQNIEKNQVSIVATNNQTRFEDITLTVDVGTLRDTTVVTIMNADIATLHVPGSTSTATTTTTAEASSTTSTATKTATTEQPKATTKPTTVTTVTPKPTPIVVPLYSGPADLVIEIAQTGVLAEVAGEETFFPVSPIPSNKVAAVTFTVTNRGGLDSGSWIFKAELPTEGDRNYSYTSPVQTSLSSGMQVEYTLGFDEIVESSKGTIKITILPTNNADKKTNNIDSVTIKIDDRS
ncbi:MAG: hypothetical protein UV60_C0019G0016 [Parcubacteria group bacterium GW2011_GWA2_43_11]|nr:MAG: hypothetical protein UV60_C0019G0016 [Parcubacteria group bacterium GW2011_GWA2_43_11]